MLIRTNFFSAPQQPGAEPYCFSKVRGEYIDLAFAVQMGKLNAVGPKMGAHSFTITDRETWKTLAEWTLTEGEWVETKH